MSAALAAEVGEPRKAQIDTMPAAKRSQTAPTPVPSGQSTQPDAGGEKSLDLLNRIGTTKAIHLRLARTTCGPGLRERVLVAA